MAIRVISEIKSKTACSCMCLSSCCFVCYALHVSWLVTIGHVEQKLIAQKFEDKHIGLKGNRNASKTRKLGNDRPGLSIAVIVAAADP